VHEANSLSVTMGANRNLKLPRFPALINDLVLIKHSERALVGFGTHAPKLIEGRSIGTLVERLLPLLDGTRSIELICAGVSVLAPKSVADALYFLFAEGLLVEGGGKSVRRQPGEVAFFDRYCGIKGNLADGHECVQRLATTKAMVLSGQQQRAIASVLLAAGLEDVSSLDIATLFDGMSDTVEQTLPTRSICGDRGLAILFIAASDLDGVDIVSAAKAVRRMGVPVLLLDPLSLSIGPLIHAGENGCLLCGLAHMPATQKSTHSAIEAEYAHALMSARIGMFVGDIVDASLHESVLRIDTETMRWQVTPAYRLPGCPCCAPSSMAASTRVDPADACDRLIEFFHLNTQDSATSASKTSHLLSYSPQVIGAVTGAYKSYPLNLRSGTLCDSADGIADALPGRVLQLMSSIACWSHAIGDGVNKMSLRAIPSAGNLASQNLYLLSGSCGGQLAAGVHYCHPDGGLVLVSGDDRRSVVANSILRHSQNGEIQEVRAKSGAVEHLYIVGTSTLARLESKYQRKAYRFALQDAGVIAYGLMSAAASAGIKAEFAANFFDEQIAEAINICSAIEIVTFVVRLELESNHDGMDE
jgi:SagB-type dehydrogenase family enzyme